MSIVQATGENIQHFQNLWVFFGSWIRSGSTDLVKSGSNPIQKTALMFRIWGGGGGGVWTISKNVLNIEESPCLPWLLCPVEERAPLCWCSSASCNKNLYAWSTLYSIVIRLKDSIMYCSLLSLREYEQTEEKNFTPVKGQISPQELRYVTQ